MHYQKKFAVAKFNSKGAKKGRSGGSRRQWRANKRKARRLALRLEQKMFEDRMSGD